MHGFELQLNSGFFFFFNGMRAKSADCWASADIEMYTYDARCGCVSVLDYPASHCGCFYICIFESV